MNFRPEVSSLGSADPREAHRLLPSSLWESKWKRKPRAATKCRVRTGDPSGTCSEEVPRSGGRRQNSCRRVSAGTQETWKDTQGNLLPGRMWDKHPHPKGYLRNTACSSPVVQTGTTRDVPAAFGSQAMRHPLHKALETDPPSPAGTTRSAEPSLCFAGRSVPAYLPGEPQQLSAGSEKPPGVPALERAAAVKHGGIPQHNLRMERASRHSGGQRCPAWGGCL